MIYVDEADCYATALEAIGATDIEIVATRGTLSTPRVNLIREPHGSAAHARGRGGVLARWA